MKKLYGALAAVLLLCTAGSVVLTLLSPDRVPMHYNLAGEVDRFGSRYENLLLPLVTVASGACLAAAAKRERKKEEKSNEKIMLITGVCASAFLTLFGFFMMIRGLRYDPKAAPGVAADDLNRFVNIGVGVLLVVLGNFMPKARRNAMFGVRTKWSQSSDAVWQKSQRFGGIAAVAAGLVLIVLALIVPGIWNVPVLIAVLTVSSALSVAASYRYDRAEKDEDAK